MSTDLGFGLLPTENADGVEDGLHSRGSELREDAASKGPPFGGSVGANNQSACGCDR